MLRDASRDMASFVVVNLIDDAPEDRPIRKKTSFHLRTPKMGWMQDANGDKIATSLHTLTD
jgi:hypothetical protein